jgi:two-component system OmpR family sensor kinase/two-component system sensor histidine kinase BaeS
MRRWQHARPRIRRALFLRFVAVFGFLLLLALGSLAALAFLFSRLFGGDGQTTILVWLGGVGLMLAFPLLAAAVALLAFRRFAVPLADLMAAADAVAAGDLTVRVPPHGQGQFARLAESFNHMVEALQLADQQRRDLTADVAHELRTPLQIIQGNLEGMLDGVYEPSENHLSGTLDETRSLARLVDDLRTLSLAEAGQLPLVWEQVDLTELLADIQTSFSGQAEAAGIELRVETEGEPSGLTVTADVGRLDQVLSNLVANALRYTPAGGAITLHAEPAADDVRLTVQDTGEGIAPEDLPFVFERFWRADPSRSPFSGGSGLGLAIARELVLAHGGRIDVHSEVGQGTTFTIHLPRKRQEAELR